MGVKYLWTLLKKYGKLPNFRGKRLAIDTSIWMHRYYRLPREKLYYSLTLKILKLLFLGIDPVFVFDGNIPELKRRVTKRKRGYSVGVVCKWCGSKSKVCEHGQTLFEEDLSRINEKRSTFWGEDIVEKEKGTLIKDIEEYKSKRKVQNFNFSEYLDTVEKMEGKEKQEKLMNLLENRYLISYDEDSTLEKFSQGQLHTLVNRNRVFRMLREISEESQQKILGNSYLRFKHTKEKKEKKYFVFTEKAEEKVEDLSSDIFSSEEDKNQKVVGSFTPNDKNIGFVTEDSIFSEETEDEEIENSKEKKYLSFDFIEENKLEEEEIEIHRRSEKDSITTEIKGDILEIREGIGDNRDIYTDNLNQEYVVDLNTKRLKSSITEGKDKDLTNNYNFYIDEKDKNKTENIQGMGLNIKNKEIDENTLKSINLKLEEEMVQNKELERKNRETLNDPKITTEENQNKEKRDMLKEDDSVDKEFPKQEDLGKFTEKITETKKTENFTKTQEHILSGMQNDLNESIMVMKELLTLFKIPYIDSPMESDGQCVSLESNNLVDGIITEDNDIFLYGGKTVYKNFFKKEPIQEFNIKDIEKDYPKEKLIEMSYWLGSDYTPGIKNYGIKKTLEENNPPNKETLEEIQNIYHNPVVKKIREIDLQRGKIDPKEILSFYKKKLNKKEEIENIMFHLQEILNR